MVRIYTMFKELLLKVITLVVYYSGLIWLFSYLKGKDSAVILAYHRVSEAKDFLSPVLDCSTESFAAHMQVVSRRFNPISLEKLVQIIKERGSIPRRCVVVTFDDGYKENIDNALPILKCYQIPATLFLTTGMVAAKELMPLHKLYYLLEVVGISEIITAISEIDPHFSSAPDLELPESRTRQRKLIEEMLGFEICSEEGVRLLGELFSRFKVVESRELRDKLYLSWDDVERMSAEGVSISAHTINHPRLSRLSYAEQEREILGSKREIERRLNTPVNMFAYPFGSTDSFNEQTKECLRSNGFSAACSGEQGSVGLESNIFALKRKAFFDQPKHEFVCEVLGFQEFLGNVKRSILKGLLKWKRK